MTVRRFMVARNPDPNSRLPYLSRVPLADGPLLLKAGAPWPRTATVYCHRADGWPEDAELLEHVQPGFVAELLAAIHIRYPSVPILFLESRSLAEEWTFRFLGAALADTAPSSRSSP